MNSPKELGILMVGYMNQGYPPEKVAELCRKDLENSGFDVKDGFDEEMIDIVNDKIERQKQWEAERQKIDDYHNNQNQ